MSPSLLKEEKWEEMTKEIRKGKRARIQKRHQSVG